MTLPIVSCAAIALLNVMVEQTSVAIRWLGSIVGSVMVKQDLRT